MASRKSTRPRASKKDAAAGESKDAPKTSVRVKVTSMGEGGAGKSCLIKRYCEGKFVRRYISTIGVDYGVKPVQRKGGKTVKVNFWDLSGHPEFFEVRNEFYKDTQAVRADCGVQAAPLPCRFAVVCCVVWCGVVVCVYVGACGVVQYCESAVVWRHGAWSCCDGAVVWRKLYHMVYVVPVV